MEELDNEQKEFEKQQIERRNQAILAEQLAKKKKWENIIDSMAIPGLFEYTFESIERLPGNNKAIELSKKWAKEDWVNPKLHHFLVLVGEPGRGKTKLALTIFVNAVYKDLTPLFYQVPNLLSKIRLEFNGKDEQGQIIEKCKASRLLILDDLGMQKNSDWVLEQLDSLIDYRYLTGSPTVFTTNLKIEELPPRISSRLSEGEIVLLSGQDYRQIKAEQRKRHV
jgi:DNA replication protein DnaC